MFVSRRRSRRFNGAEIRRYFGRSSTSMRQLADEAENCSARTTSLLIAAEHTDERFTRQNKTDLLGDGTLLHPIGDSFRLSVTVTEHNIVRIVNKMSAIRQLLLLRHLYDQCFKCKFGAQELRVVRGPMGLNRGPYHSIMVPLYNSVTILGKHKRS